DGCPFADLARRPGAEEVLVVVDAVPVVAVGSDRLNPEGIDVPVLADVIAAHSLEGAAGGWPRERADEPLRAEQKLLPAHAQVGRAVVELAELDLGEEVEHLTAV